MKKFSPYTIALGALPQGLSTRDFELDTAFFEAMDCPDILYADVDARVDLDRRGDSFDCTITMRGTIGIPCDRCLDRMDLHVDESYTTAIDLGDCEANFDADRLRLPQGRAELDFAPLLRDTVLLAIPLRHVHPEGECNAEMSARLADCSSASGDEED